MALAPAPHTAHHSRLRRAPVLCGSFPSLLCSWPRANPGPHGSMDTPEAAPPWNLTAVQRTLRTLRISHRPSILASAATLSPPVLLTRSCQPHACGATPQQLDLHSCHTECARTHSRTQRPPPMLSVTAAPVASLAWHTHVARLAFHCHPFTTRCSDASAVRWGPRLRCVALNEASNSDSFSPL